MKRIAVVALVVAAFASCRGKEDPVRQLDGSSGVDTSGMGSYYSGPQPWEAQAREAYKVPQPTGSAPAPATK